MRFRLFCVLCVVSAVLLAGCSGSDGIDLKGNVGGSVGLTEETTGVTVESGISTESITKETTGVSVEGDISPEIVTEESESTGKSSAAESGKEVSEGTDRGFASAESVDGSKIYSGEVEILGTKIQLPCSIDEFFALGFKDDSDYYNSSSLRPGKQSSRDLVYGEDVEITVYMWNNTNSEQMYNDCVVQGIWVWDDTLGFVAPGGISFDMAFSEVVSKLEEPKYKYSEDSGMPNYEYWEIEDERDCAQLALYGAENGSIIGMRVETSRIK